MKAEKLFVLLGEAGEPWMGEPRRRFRFPAAVAALLVVALILPLVMIGTDKQQVGPIATLIWQGRIYELVETSDRLDLPRLREERVGEPIGSGRREDDTSEVMLYQYLPAAGEPCEALLTARVGDGWCYAVFCNYDVRDSAAKPTFIYEPAHLLALYGVTGPEDVVSLQANGKETGQQEAFIRALEYGNYYSEALYQDRVYGGLTDAQQQEKSRALAETHIQLRLETASGIVFWMGYQPETGFVDWCLGHFRVG